MLKLKNWSESKFNYEKKGNLEERGEVVEIPLFGAMTAARGATALSRRQVLRAALPLERGGGGEGRLSRGGDVRERGDVESPWRRRGRRGGGGLLFGVGVGGEGGDEGSGGGGVGEVNGFGRGVVEGVVCFGDLVEDGRLLGGLCGRRRRRERSSSEAGVAGRGGGWGWAWAEERNDVFELGNCEVSDGLAVDGDLIGGVVLLGGLREESDELLYALQTGGGFLDGIFLRFGCESGGSVPGHELHGHSCGHYSMGEEELREMVLVDKGEENNRKRVGNGYGYGQNGCYRFGCFGPLGHWTVTLPCFRQMLVPITI